MYKWLFLGIVLCFWSGVTFCQSVDTLQGRNLLEEGKRHITEKEYNAAISEIHEAIEIYQKYPKSPAYRDCLIALAEAYDKQEDLQMALTVYQKALSVTDSLYKDLHMLYLNIGRMHGLLGDYSEAKMNYFKSLDIVTQRFGPNHLSAAWAYNNIGVNLEAVGDYSQALTYYHRALNIRRNILGEKHELVGDILHNISNSHYYMNQLDEAESYCQQALAIRLAVLGNAHVKIAYSYTTLGIIQAMRQNYPKSLTYFRKELNIKQQLLGPDHMDLVYSYNNLGVLYNRMQKHEKSLTAHQKALSIIKKNVGERHPFLAQTYDNISQDYRNLNNYPKAIEQVQSALICVHRTFDETNPEINPPIVGSLSEREMLRMLSNKSQIYFEYALKQKGDKDLLEKGLSACRRAIELMELMQRSYKAEESKLFLQQSGLTVYNRGLEILYLLHQQTDDLAYLEEAFIYTEKSKSTLLLGAIQDNRAKAYAGIPTDVLEKESALKQELRSFDSQIKAETDSQQIAIFQNQSAVLKMSYDSLVQRLEHEYPAYYQLKYAIPKITLEQAQKEWLAEGQDLLMYYDSDSTIHAFYITENETKWTKISIDFPLEESIGAFHKSIYSYFIQPEKTDKSFVHNDSIYHHFGHLLYQKLVAPIMDKRTKMPERLLIIPSGNMSYLPFEALLTQPQKVHTDFRNASYFLHQTHIQYAYSGRVHLEMRNRKLPTNQKGILGVAPTFSSDSQRDTIATSRSSLAPLISNRMEIQKVHELTGGKLLMAEEATRKNFLESATAYSILHLATHGKLNDDDPNQSFLAFTDVKDTSETPFLYLRELYNLNLPAEMVVLSACETGIGKLLGGEGMASLSRGFSYAGAKSILTTLWSINDMKAAELMESYYQFLAEGFPKDVALSKAKRKFLSQNDDYFSHPYFWGGYIAIGEMEPISFTSYSSLAWVGGLLILAFILGMVLYRRSLR